MSFIEAGAPKIIMEITNLGDGFALSNTDAGKAFNLENPGQKTDKVLGVLNVSADIVPHRKRLATNEFTVTGGTWVATADPFGVGSGLQALATGVDIVDTLTGLFLSPYAHGLQSPKVVCK